VIIDVITTIHTYAQKFQVLQKAWGTEHPRFHTYPIVPTAYAEFAIISHLHFSNQIVSATYPQQKEYYEIAHEGKKDNQQIET
jgi:hypothetical protein